MLKRWNFWHRNRLSCFKRQASTLSDCFSERATTPERTGLFRRPALTSPGNFHRYADAELAVAADMAENIATYEVSKSTAAELIQRLDVLSDTLCKIVDLAAFVRISHPSTRMAAVAQRIHEQAFTFMNELNTDRRLYDRACESLCYDLPQDEARVGQILKHDFEKSGIQFDAATRQTFVEASNTVSVLGQQFLQGAGASPQTLLFSESELAGVNPQLLSQLPRQPFSARIRVPLAASPLIGEHILASAHSSDTRRKVWQALRTAPVQQPPLLLEVLKGRHEIATLAEYPNFAAYELSDKMMARPSTVAKFLSSLESAVRPQALSEAAKLGVAAPWDYSYSQSHQVRQRASRGAEYTIGEVFQGFSDITSQLYGLRFEPGVVQSGEVWDPEVRRLDVFEDGELIGHAYCDLFSREGKQPNPAHFTIQCSRKKWPWEGPEVPDKQLPIIALVCDFHSSGILSAHEVQTLFHEMGHAVHSMLGRTRMHNVAGTRCATDFVELPSILMERFAAQVLGADILTRESAWETHHQIFLASLDQQLHAHQPPAEITSLAASAHSVEDRLTLFPNVSGQHTQQYAQFGHLISYGATYYSYLLDRCLANMIWNEVFAANPSSEAAGRKFKDDLLRWGGSRQAETCIENVLGRKLDYTEVAKYIS